MRLIAGLRRGRPLEAASGPRGKGEKVGALGNQPSKGWPDSPPGAGKAAASGLPAVPAIEGNAALFASSVPFAGSGKHGCTFRVCSISSGGLDHKWACRILGGGGPSHDASALAFTCGEGGRGVTMLLGDEAKKNPVETGWNVGGRGMASGHRATSPQRAGLIARLGRERPLEAACVAARRC